LDAYDIAAESFFVQSQRLVSGVSERWWFERAINHPAGHSARWWQPCGNVAITTM
jgi:hypothetical protein